MLWGFHAGYTEDTSVKEHKCWERVCTMSRSGRYCGLESASETSRGSYAGFWNEHMLHSSHPFPWT